MEEDEIIEEEQTNTVGIFHVKPVEGGFIIEGKSGGKGESPPMQAIVAGSLESGNSRKAVERNVRKMVKSWLALYFAE